MSCDKNEISIRLSQNQNPCYCRNEWKFEFCYWGILCDDSGDDDDDDDCSDSYDVTNINRKDIANIEF